VLVPDRDPQRRIVDIQQWRRCKFFGECLENAEREKVEERTENYVGPNIFF
jgi:hypothetical protein